MVEQGIYFALGCIVTALLALMVAPAFWSRALRLTRKRLQLQVPLSMQEILAERDQLRAEFAVERLRIEQALERVESSKAADMAEIGRRSMETAALRDDLAEARDVAAAREREIGRLDREAAEASAQHGALHQAIVGTQTQVDLWRQRAEASAEDGDRLRDDLEQHRTTIAGLKTRAMGLEMRLTDAERSGATRLKDLEEGLHRRLEAAMAQSARHEGSAIDLRRERDDAKARVRAVEADLQQAEERAQTLDRRGTDVGTRLEAALAQSTLHEEAATDLRRERDEARARIEALESELDRAREQVQALDRRGDEADRRLEAAVTRSQAQDASLAALRQDHDDALARIRALDVELDRARGREQALQLQASLRDRRGAPSEVVAPTEGSDADLRASIHALGLAVAKMMRASGAPSNGSGTPQRPARTPAPSPVDAN